MTLGIGLYAPCMIMISLLGMNPTAAFPIMMGSCAFLMPVGSMQFIRKDELRPARRGRPRARRAAGGADRRVHRQVAAALYVRWLVVVVVVYTAIAHAAHRGARARDEELEEALMSRLAAIVLVLCLGWSGLAAGGPNERIFFLDLRGKIVSATPEGNDRQVLVEGLKGQPDGIAVDVEAGHIYWTNMGDSAADDGSIERSNLDGSNVTTIVKAGGTYTQATLARQERRQALLVRPRRHARDARRTSTARSVETLVETGRRRRRP